MGVFVPHLQNLVRGIFSKAKVSFEQEMAPLLSALEHPPAKQLLRQNYSNIGRDKTVVMRDRLKVVLDHFYPSVCNPNFSVNLLRLCFPDFTSRVGSNSRLPGDIWQLISSEHENFSSETFP